MRGKLFLLVLALTLVFPSASLASAPTQVAYSDSSVVVPFYGYGDSGDCTTACLKFAGLSCSNFACHDAATWTGKIANYTNFMCIQSGTIQTWGMGITAGTATLTCPGGVSPLFTELSVAFTTSPKVFFYYKMPTSLTYSVPQSVLYTAGGSTVEVDVGAYTNVAATFSSCATPCVFFNLNNGTMAVKFASTSPVTLDFYYSPYSSPSGVTPPCVACQNLGLGAGGTPPPQSSGLTLIILALILVLAVGYISTREARGFKAPSEGKRTVRLPRDVPSEVRKPVERAANVALGYPRTVVFTAPKAVTQAARAPERAAASINLPKVPATRMRTPSASLVVRLPKRLRQFWRRPKK